MIAYEVTINGSKVAAAGLRQGVVSAIANWIFVPSDIAKDADDDWSASFSLAGLDDFASEDVKWFRRDLKVGDEIVIRLVQTDHVDTPSERTKR